MQASQSTVHELSGSGLHLRGQGGEHEPLWELLDGEHIHKERAAPQTLHRQAAEDCIQGQDAARQDDHVGVLLAEVVGISKEGHPQGSCLLSIIRPGSC